MALQTYADLTSAVASFSLWPNAPIPMFIALAEEAIRPVLKHRLMETTITLSVVGGSSPTLPDDYQEIRAVLYNGYPIKPVSFYRTSKACSETGYVITGNTLQILPTPADDYTIDLYYYQRLPALTDANQTNWLMANFASVYLHATLAQLYHWAKDSDAEAKEKSLLGESLTVMARDHTRTTQYGNTIIEELSGW
ncbi:MULTISPECIES: hypothetical protein [unclassified Rhizobium]|uniref:phage adaptor protein n=1 Tax=unclassified Rhizobium TaxID=2613769 RepID=UPI001160B01F|nr:MULTISPECIES: hypothetical protein [unclassified Rhizobium]TQX87144.1 hypothetical protein EQW76_14885 [Rhizobium sp. rho-13.1]TQY14233.1 hypothetical protein EQW74_13735 [Rhizobium sp. rho-1.1]